MFLNYDFKFSLPMAVWRLGDCVLQFLVIYVNQALKLIFNRGLKAFHQQHRSLHCTIDEKRNPELSASTLTTGGSKGRNQQHRKRLRPVGQGVQSQYIKIISPHAGLSLVLYRFSVSCATLAYGYLYLATAWLFHSWSQIFHTLFGQL